MSYETTARVKMTARQRREVARIVNEIAKEEGMEPEDYLAVTPAGRRGYYDVKGDVYAVGDVLAEAGVPYDSSKPTRCR